MTPLQVSGHTYLIPLHQLSTFLLGSLVGYPNIRLREQVNKGIWEAERSTLLYLLLALHPAGSTLRVPLPCPELPELLLQAIASLEVKFMLFSFFPRSVCDVQAVKW